MSVVALLHAESQGVEFHQVFILFQSKKKKSCFCFSEHTKRLSIPVLIPASSTHRWNVWICVWSQLPGGDNRVGRICCGRPLHSQLSLRHLHRSGPHQQGCGPPQVRRITRTMYSVSRFAWGILHTCIKISLFPLPLSADGTTLSLKTTQKTGRPWFHSFFRKHFFRQLMRCVCLQQLRRTFP